MKRLLTGLFFLTCYVLVQAQSRVFTCDNGDGTFTNPVIYSDFPDIDIIRVDDVYYMLSTTMFYFPGGTIMRSYDLVNWEYCANPIKIIEDDNAFTLKNDEHRYARGMWASSFQYNKHDGWYYLLYNTLNDGSYLMRTKDINGSRWSKSKLNHSFYDCGVLFDEDGKIYVARGNGQIWIDRVSSDFKVQQSWQVCDSPEGSTYEGSRLYHIGDYYYVYCVDCAWPGKQMCFRSKTMEGPWEKKLLLDDKVVHQGGLVQLPNGDWWTMLFRDMWPWGRLPYLLPVKFDDNWPVIGDNGKVIDRPTKPTIEVSAEHSGVNTPRVATNDGFRDTKLGLQWEWNHIPDNNKWSLTDRPGFMRLKTATVTNDIWKARNTLTQRMFGYLPELKKSYGTFRIDISKMQDGDCCGITTLQDPHAYLCIKMTDGIKEISVMQTSLTGKTVGNGSRPTKITDDVIYLRGIASFDGTGTIDFYRSSDAVKWTKVGSSFTMQYDLSVFVGNRWGIFNYATKALGGYIDIDWFSTDPEFDEDEFYKDESLAIASPVVKHTNTKGVYTLQGVKMTNPSNLPPGVYLRNGKKVVVR